MCQSKWKCQTYFYKTCQYTLSFLRAWQSSFRCGLLPGFQWLSLGPKVTKDIANSSNSHTPAQRTFRENSPGLGSQPVFLGAQSSSFGTLSSTPHTFFSLLTQTRIAYRVFEGECLESPSLYQEQRDSLSCCTWRTIHLLYLGYELVSGSVVSVLLYFLILIRIRNKLAPAGFRVISKNINEWLQAW